MRGEQWQARPRGNPYLEIFRLPGALAFSATGALARTPMAMFGLGTVLLISAITGRYGLRQAPWRRPGRLATPSARRRRPSSPTDSASIACSGRWP